MTDIFHSDVPFLMLADLFWVVEEWCPRLTFQVLTKRPGRMVYFANHVLNGEWPSNVWAGTSVESAKYLPRLDVLARVPAKVRFVSVEPCLGPLDLKPYFFKCSGCGEKPCACKGLAINWVIAGGESGPGARPMHPDWARGLRDQCQAAGVPFFFKQWGAFVPKSQTSLSSPPVWGSLNRAGAWWNQTTPWNGHDDDGSGEAVLYRVGKKAAGALLDGREWREMPPARRE
jgi:protein gp37